MSLSDVAVPINGDAEQTTERKTCCALDEQLRRLLLARPIGLQVVEKKYETSSMGSQDELIGAGVPE